MANYNRLEKKSKFFSQNKKDGTASLPDGASTKGLSVKQQRPQIVENPQFWLPKTQISYLTLHGIMASLELARAESYKRIEREPNLPVGVTFKQTDKFWVFSKSGDRIKVDRVFLEKIVNGTDAESAALESIEKARVALKTADGEAREAAQNKLTAARAALRALGKRAYLTRFELSILPLALIFIISQSQKKGKTIRRVGGEFECNRQDFLAWAGLENRRFSAQVLKAAAKIISTTKISVRGGDYASLYNARQNTPQGVAIFVSKENGLFRQFFRSTHAVPCAALTELNLRELRAYLELKSAAALKYASTAVGNLIAAAGLRFNAKSNRHVGDARRKVAGILKAIAKFDETFKKIATEFEQGGRAFLKTQIHFGGESTDEPADEPTRTWAKTQDALPPPFLPPAPQSVLDALWGAMPQFVQKVKQTPKPPDNAPHRRRHALTRAFCEWGLDFLKPFLKKEN